MSDDSPEMNTAEMPSYDEQQQEPEAPSEEMQTTAEGYDEASNGGVDNVGADNGQMGAAAMVGDEQEPQEHDEQQLGAGGGDEMYGGQIFPFDDLAQKDYSSDENYHKLVSFGLHPLVAAEFCELFNAGIMDAETCEERTLEFSKNMQPDHARFVLNQFRKSNLTGVHQPSSYLGSLVKNFKERIKLLGPEVAMSTPVVFSPPKEKIQAMLDKHGYTLEVTIGQRKYGGPPPGFDGAVPSGGCEVYIGKVPKDVYEDELVALFEECGQLYDLRLMMDPLSGTNKGYAFATFIRKEDAGKASKKYDGYEIRPGKKIRCNVSIANTRLFIGNIPKSKSKEDILEEFQNNSDIEGLIDVIVYPHAEDPEKKKNRGFAFLEFNEHKMASTAKRRLSSGRIRPWNCDLVVDWAEPQDEPDEEAMAQVKALYVKNVRDHINEDMIREAFSPYGELEKVKKLKDYCFVHFADRDNALKAIEAMHGKELHGCTLDVTLARPQTDNKKKNIMSRMSRLQMRGGGRDMGMRGSPGGGMYGAGDPYMGGYGGGYMGGAGYGGGYDAYGGGYEYSTAYPGYDYGAMYATMSPQAGGGMRSGGRGGGSSYGTPRSGGGSSGRPMTRGGRGGGMSYGRGGMPVGGGGGGMMRRGGAGFGGPGGGRPVGKGGIAIKRTLPSGASTSSPKRKNDGEGYWQAGTGQPKQEAQDWSADNF